MQAFTSFLVGTQGEFMQSNKKNINVRPNEEFNNQFDDKPRKGHRPTKGKKKGAKLKTKQDYKVELSSEQSEEDENMIDEDWINYIFLIMIIDFNS